MHSFTLEQSSYELQIYTNNIQYLKPKSDLFSKTQVLDDFLANILFQLVLNWFFS